MRGMMNKKNFQKYFYFTFVLTVALTILGAFPCAAQTIECELCNSAGKSSAMTPPIESPTMIRPNDFSMADGDLDSSFGTGGLAQRPQVSGFESIGDSVVQPDLKIVAVGESDEKIALARYETNGVLDPTFGTNGTVVVPDLYIAATFTYGIKAQIALQPNGKIVVSGHINTNPTLLTPNVRVLRFNADGTPDTSFGTNGRVSVQLMPPDGETQNFRSS